MRLPATGPDGTMLGAQRPPEVPLAILEQHGSGRHGHYELFRDRVRSSVSTLMGTRSVTLPLDSLSPHVVVRNTGPTGLLIATVALSLGLFMLPTLPVLIAAGVLLSGVALWWLSRTSTIVFPGQIADLELLRDRPDSASARRFVSQTMMQIKALHRELREFQRSQSEQPGRVEELVALRELYVEGIIDRKEMRLAAELLGREEQGRIGFR